MHGAVRGLLDKPSLDDRGLDGRGSDGLGLAGLGPDDLGFDGLLLDDARFDASSLDELRLDASGFDESRPDPSAAEQTDDRAEGALSRSADPTGDVERWCRGVPPTSGGAVHWQVQTAKQRFSEVLRAAVAGEPQIVTRHGEEIAVIIDIAEYRRLHGQSVSFMEFLAAEPCADAEFEIERSRDLPRSIDLIG